VIFGDCCREKILSCQGGSSVESTQTHKAITYSLCHVCVYVCVWYVCMCGICMCGICMCLYVCVVYVCMCGICMYLYM